MYRATLSYVSSRQYRFELCPEMLRLFVGETVLKQERDVLGDPSSQLWSSVIPMLITHPNTICKKNQQNNKIYFMQLESNSENSLISH